MNFAGETIKNPPRGKGRRASGCLRYFRLRNKSFHVGNFKVHWLISQIHRQDACHCMCTRILCCLTARHETKHQQQACSRAWLQHTQVLLHQVIMTTERIDELDNFLHLTYIGSLSLCIKKNNNNKKQCRSCFSYEGLIKSPPLFKCFGIPFDFFDKEQRNQLVCPWVASNALGLPEVKLKAARRGGVVDRGNACFFF